MAAATSDEIRTALADVLKQAGADVSSYWDGHCVRGAEFALNEVESRLLARGFRLNEEILLWDRLHEFTLDLGVWKAVHLGGAYSSYDTEALRAMDRREELATVFVSVNGTYVKPASGQAGTAITSGPVDDSGGQFRYGDGGEHIVW